MKRSIALFVALGTGVACSSSQSGTDAIVQATANINEPLMPVARGEKYGAPLDAFLRERGIGEVTGGGTSLGPDGKPGWIDIGFELAYPERNAVVVAGKLKEFGAPPGSYVHYFLGNEQRKVPIR